MTESRNSAGKDPINIFFAALVIFPGVLLFGGGCYSIVGRALPSHLYLIYLFVLAAELYRRRKYIEDGSARRANDMATVILISISSIIFILMTIDRLFVEEFIYTRLSALIFFYAILSHTFVGGPRTTRSDILLILFSITIVLPISLSLYLEPKCTYYPLSRCLTSPICGFLILLGLSAFSPFLYFYLSSLRSYYIRKRSEGLSGGL